MKDQVEIWQPVVGLEGLYDVSNMGRVRSYYKKVGRGRNVVSKSPQKILSTENINKQGYCIVSLFKGGKRSNKKLVHRLVAESFIQRIDGKNLINHKNGIRNDNRVENLEWCNHSENAKHYFEVLGGEPKTKGIKKSSAKPIYLFDLNVNLVGVYRTRNELSAALGKRVHGMVSYSLTHKVATGGYFYCYDRYGYGLRSTWKFIDKVVKMTQEWEVVREYDSAGQASNEINSLHLYNVLKSNDARIYRGYRWVYKQNLKTHKNINYD